jgi:hypothetical protein
MPEAFAPPQPKQWLAGLGSSMSLAHIVFDSLLIPSNYRSTARQFRTFTAYAAVFSGVLTSGVKTPLRLPTSAR